MEADLRHPCRLEQLGELIRHAVQKRLIDDVFDQLQAARRQAPFSAHLSVLCLFVDVGLQLLLRNLAEQIVLLFKVRKK